MKYVKRLYFSAVALPIAITLAFWQLAIGIWVDGEIDNESWKFWQ